MDNLEEFFYLSRPAPLLVKDQNPIMGSALATPSPPIPNHYCQENYESSDNTISSDMVSNNDEDFGMPSFQESEWQAACNKVSNDYNTVPEHIELKELYALAPMRREDQDEEQEQEPHYFNYDAEENYGEVPIYEEPAPVVSVQLPIVVEQVQVTPMPMAAVAVPVAPAPPAQASPCKMPTRRPRSYKMTKEDDKNTAEYREKRKRNNESVVRSRDKKKREQEEIEKAKEKKMADLEVENYTLKIELKNAHDKIRDYEQRFF